MNNEVDLCVTISLNYLPPLFSLGLQQIEPQATTCLSNLAWGYNIKSLRLYQSLTPGMEHQDTIEVGGSV